MLLFTGETGRWKKPKFTVKLITSMKCGSRSLLKQYTLAKTRETFTKSLLNIGAGNNSVEILVLHDNTNDGWKLLQVDLDTDDVMELRLDAFGGKTLLGEVSSIWNEPGCSLHSLDFQYPVEKNYFRIHVEAKVLQRCHPNKWNKDLLIPTSDLYKSYKEDLEYKIFKVIDEIRLGHYVNNITLAYFFPNSSQTFGVFYLDLDKDSLEQGSLSIKTAAEKLSGALKKPEKCSGRSLLSAKVKYETGNWKRPPITEETPRTDTSLTVTMAAIYNCGQLSECSADLVGELLLNAFSATKITMNVGLLSTIIPHETDCLILSRQEFYLDELHFHGLSSTDAQLFLDVVNSYSQEMKCSADELGFHIDAELQEDCNPIPWNLELYNLGSNFSRSYRKIVENKIKNVLKTLNYRHFTAGYEVAYFYPYQDLLRVIIRLDFEKRLDANHSIQVLTNNIIDRLKDPENCQGALLIPGDNTSTFLKIIPEGLSQIVLNFLEESVH
ncbi:hypothetical protein FGIG_11557 [Fasciola gigantica]|uniref:Uncharacterized protein n=1 Tax=Fasciola gigantica TaxID=46835 RepID=A0A504ZA73_FASGI|nr:hypothetical protein FGIG_11557 [Fasciola gigantica]